MLAPLKVGDSGTGSGIISDVRPSTSTAEPGGGCRCLEEVSGYFGFYRFLGVLDFGIEKERLPRELMIITRSHCLLCFFSFWSTPVKLQQVAHCIMLPRFVFA